MSSARSIKQTVSGEDLKEIIGTVEKSDLGTPSVGSLGSGKEKLMASRYFLTYSDWLDKAQLVSFFKDLRFDEKFTLISHETGKTGYKHTHVFIKKMGSLPRFQRMETKVFDFTDESKNKIYHPFIVKITAKNHEYNVKKYILKDDKSNEGIRKQILEDCSEDVAKEGKECKSGRSRHILPSIEQAKKDRDAVKKCHILTDALAEAASRGIMSSEAKELFEIGQKERNSVVFDEKEEDKKFYPSAWQLFVLKIADTFLKHPDNMERTVYWFGETVGGTGKTMVSDYLERKYPMNVIIEDGKTEYGPMYGVIKNINSRNGAAGTYIFIINLPQSYNDTDKFYAFIENIKDGRLKSSKYGGGLVVLKHKPLIIVMANTFPRANKSLSVDRLETYEITPDCSRRIIWRKEKKIIFNIDDLYKDDLKIDDIDIYEKERIDRKEKELKKRRASKGINENITLDALKKRAEELRKQYDHVLAGDEDDSKLRQELYSAEEMVRNEELMEKEVDNFFRKGIDAKELSKYAVNPDVYSCDYIPVKLSQNESDDRRLKKDLDEKFASNVGDYFDTRPPSQRSSGATSPARKIQTTSPSFVKINSEDEEMTEKREETTRREIEEKVRKEIEEKVRKELEEKIRKEIEEKVRKETEEESKTIPSIAVPVKQPTEIKKEDKMMKEMKDSLKKREDKAIELRIEKIRKIKAAGGTFKEAFEVAETDYEKELTEDIFHVDKNGIRQ